MIVSCIIDIDMILLFPGHTDIDMRYVKLSGTWSLSATQRKVPHHIHAWWGPPLEFVGVTSKIHGGTSKIPHEMFPVIMFNDINNTRALLSCYLLHALLLFLIYCVVKI